MAQSLSVLHSCPTSPQTQLNPTSARAPHYHTSTLLHETVSLQLFIFPFAVFNTFTPQHSVLVPQKEHCASLLHTFLRVLHLCFSLHTIGVSHLAAFNPLHFNKGSPLELPQPISTPRPTHELQHTTSQGPLLKQVTLPSTLSTLTQEYIWFPPILDLHRAHRALHGNTPTSLRKSDPPPLIPPPSPSPTPTRRKKSTSLDYTDDISLGNPSVASRKAPRDGATPTTSSSKKHVATPHHPPPLPKPLHLSSRLALPALAPTLPAPPNHPSTSSLPPIMDPTPSPLRQHYLTS